MMHWKCIWILFAVALPLAMGDYKNRKFKPGDPNSIENMDNLFADHRGEQNTSCFICQDKGKPFRMNELIARNHRFDMPNCSQPAGKVVHLCPGPCIVAEYYRSTIFGKTEIEYIRDCFYLLETYRYGQEPVDITLRHGIMVTIKVCSEDGCNIDTDHQSDAPKVFINSTVCAPSRKWKRGCNVSPTPGNSFWLTIVLVFTLYSRM